VPFYDSIALDLVGYDAIIIGNHDFDFGPEVLADFITGFGSLSAISRASRRTWLWCPR
jgi:5'-nucleotidase